MIYSLLSIQHYLTHESCIIGGFFSCIPGYDNNKFFQSIKDLDVSAIMSYANGICDLHNKDIFSDCLYLIISHELSLDNLISKKMLLNYIDLLTILRVKIFKMSNSIERDMYIFMVNECIHTNNDLVKVFLYGNIATIEQLHDLGFDFTSNICINNAIRTYMNSSSVPSLYLSVLDLVFIGFSEKSQDSHCIQCIRYILEKICCFHRGVLPKLPANVFAKIELFHDILTKYKIPYETCSECQKQLAQLFMCKFWSEDIDGMKEILAYGFKINANLFLDDHENRSWFWKYYGHGHGHSHGHGDSFYSVIYKIAHETNKPKTIRFLKSLKTV